MEKFAFVLVVLVLSSCISSKYSNCVIVNDENIFVGEWLKYKTNPELHKTILTTECISYDNKIDGGDGFKTGKVRWAECLSGPDCNEAGMF